MIILEEVRLGRRHWYSYKDIVSCVDMCDNKNTLVNFIENNKRLSNQDLFNLDVLSLNELKARANHIIRRRYSDVTKDKKRERKLWLDEQEKYGSMAFFFDESISPITEI